MYVNYRCVPRDKINPLYRVDKTVPTLKTLNTYIVEKTEFHRYTETLRKIILEMGYKYKKFQSNRTS